MNGSSNPTVEVPTVVITVTQALLLPPESRASYSLHNGGSAVSMDSGGDITVNAPTDIRFVIQSADGTVYRPVGVSFRQAGTPDPNGPNNFTTSVAYQTIVIHDDDRVTGETYVYRIVFEDQNGFLYVLR